MSTVVYYARFGDLVKIGTTSDLPTRMQALKPDELLATEPGDVRAERHRHGQFHSDRVHLEFFRASEALLEHIRLLNGPPETRPPLDLPDLDEVREQILCLVAEETAARKHLAEMQEHLETVVRQAVRESPMTHVEIGEILGVHRNTVMNWCKK